MIELLVVISIIAVMSAVVAFSVGTGDSSKKIVGEGKRLAAVVEMAVDEAIFNGEEIGLEIFTDGYRFLIWEKGEAPTPPQTSVNAPVTPVVKVKKEGKWVVKGDDKVFREYELPTGLRNYLEVEDEEIDLVELEDKSEIEESDDDDDDYLHSDILDGDKKIVPHIMFLSSGEVTAFKLQMSLNENTEVKIVIDVNLLGKVKMLKPGEEDDF